jgi:adenylate cyclase
VMKLELKFSLLIALFGAFILCSYLFKLAPFYTFSLQFNDINYALNPQKPNEEIIFVAVDEKSVNTLGRWPWDRSVVAKGLAQLEQSKVVVLDMVFSEPTNKKSDQALANTIDDLGNVVCGLFFRDSASEHLDEERAYLLEESSLELDAVNVPLHEFSFVESNIEPIMQSCFFNASFTTISDQDQLYRRYPLGAVYNGSVYLPLGFATIQLLMQERLTIKKENEHFIAQIGEQKIGMGDDGYLLLNYAKEESSYPQISFIDMLNGTVPKAYFKDKIVLLGITEAGVTDIRATPLGQIPGPLLHYTFLSNFLDKNFIHKETLYDIVAILLFFLLPLLLLKIEHLYKRVIVYLLSGLGYFIFAKLLYVLANIWIDTFFVLNATIVMALLCEYYLYKKREDETKLIKEAFSNYLSNDLLEILYKHPEQLKLGGESKEITTLFSDIRNFTSISEKIDSTQLVELLNIYFNPMTDAVIEHKGMLDKYIGDAIMAFFNAPIDLPRHAKHACECALEMVEKLHIVQETLKEKKLLPEGLEFDIGIGLNTAEVVVGNMGADNRFNYTVIGDGVNLASRLEGQTKNYRVKIIISEFTQLLIEEHFLTRKLDTIKVKGKDNAVGIYELMDNSQENQAIKVAYEKALVAYELGNIIEAKTLFLEKTLSQDVTTKAFLAINRKKFELS